MTFPNSDSPEPSSPPQPPRIWTALALGGCLLPVICLIGIVLLIVFVLALMLLGQGPSPDGIEAWFDAKMNTLTGFTLMMLLSQLPMLAITLLAARLSPEPMAERLGFVPMKMAWWELVLCLLSVPFVGLLGSSLMTLFFGHELSENLRMLYDTIRTAPLWFLIPLTLLVSVLPGFTEEILYRGYVQRRLLKRWHPALAIVVSSLLFSAIHLDPQHIVAVIPIGFWLGFIAWKSESLWPAILCHTANNLLAIVITRWSEADLDAPFWAMSWVEWAISGLSALIFVAAVWALMRRRTAPENADGEGVLH